MPCVKLPLLTVALLLIGAAFVIPLPDPVELPPTGVDILDRHGRLLYQAIDPLRGGSRQVSLEAIAPALQQATITVEDASFDSNPGVDPLASLRALAQDIAAGRVVAGGSTITQQLARLRYLPAEQRSSQSLERKVWESWLALRLTGALGKNGILENYLNSAPYGNLAVGAEAAAWTYFAKPARELSVAEAALLAGLPQSPTDYDPYRHPQAALARQQVVLDLMQRHGLISATQAQAARAEPIKLNDRPFPLSAAHFVDYVRSVAPAGAARVWTTLDRDVQAQAEQAAQRQIARLADHDVSDAAVVVVDPHSGEVLAMVGGVDYFDAAQPGAQVNMAVAPRQPGSAFKPITYAAALESGRFSPASILDDQRTIFHTRQGEPYVPENYDHQFHGQVSLRVALASSFNVPAVEVLAGTGLDRVLGLAADLGLGDTLGDPERYDLSLTLGGGDVRLLDLTAAYGAFAAGGMFHPAVAIVRAEDAAGHVIDAGPLPPARRVLSPETAFVLDDILADDAARGPGFGRDGVLHLAGRSVAVKTGTTSDFRDNWTVGFTPDLVVGVWVGNADNRPMRDVSGVTGAGPLWRDVLDGLLDSSAPRPFERPADVVQVELCADSEALAGPGCASHRLEWLLKNPRFTPATTIPPIQAPLRIVFPDPDAIISLDPAVPVAAQQLAVDVEANGATGRIELLVDGAVVGARAQPGPIAWPPAPGRHSLQVRSAEFTSEGVKIEVVPF